MSWKKYKGGQIKKSTPCFIIFTLFFFFVKSYFHFDLLISTIFYLLISFIFFSPVLKEIFNEIVLNIKSDSIKFKTLNVPDYEKGDIEKNKNFNINRIVDNQVNQNPKRWEGPPVWEASRNIDFDITKIVNNGISKDFEESQGPPTWESSKSPDFNINKLVENENVIVNFDRFIKALFRVFYFIAKLDAKIDLREEKLIDGFIYGIAKMFPENKSYLLYSLASTKSNVKDEKNINLKYELNLLNNFLLNEKEEAISITYEFFIDSIINNKNLGSKDLDILETIDSVFDTKNSQSLLDKRDSLFMGLEANQITVYYKWYSGILKRKSNGLGLRKYLNNQYIKWKTLEQSRYDHLRIKSKEVQKIILELRKEL
tara:strand:- start:1034 stop:2146 length:1113 start_codon:yes stop_codon:yes gene_type:complete